MGLIAVSAIIVPFLLHGLQGLGAFRRGEKLERPPSDVNGWAGSAATLIFYWRWSLGAAVALVLASAAYLALR